jgi:hypothetical protein
MSSVEECNAVNFPLSGPNSVGWEDRNIQGLYFLFVSAYMKCFDVVQYMVSPCFSFQKAVQESDLPTGRQADNLKISTVFAEQGASRVPRQDSILLLSRFQYLYYYH